MKDSTVMTNFSSKKLYASICSFLNITLHLTRAVVQILDKGRCLAALVRIKFVKLCSSLLLTGCRHLATSLKDKVNSSFHFLFSLTLDNATHITVFIAQHATVNVAQTFPNFKNLVIRDLYFCTALPGVELLRCEKTFQLEIGL